jgi:hypothetical protein
MDTPAYDLEGTTRLYNNKEDRKCLTGSEMVADIIRGLPNPSFPSPELDHIGRRG